MSSASPARTMACARLLAVARHWLGQADAAAGRLLRGLPARPYRALAAIVAMAGLLIAFSWLALDVRDTSAARAAADGRLARTAAALRYEEARIEALTAELRQLAQSAPPTQASTAPARRPDVRSPAGRAQAAGRPPPPPSSLTVMSLQPQQSPAAMPAPGMPAASAITVRHPEGSIRVSAPTDVPLSEVMLDLLELAGLPDHDRWALGPLDGDPYPPHRTLARARRRRRRAAGAARDPRRRVGRPAGAQ